MLSFAWESLWARRRRLAGIWVAVVLGVSFLMGTLVLGDTISTTFDRLFTDTTAGTDLVVRGESPVATSLEADLERRPIDAALVGELAALDDVAVAEGQITGYGQLLGADGDPIGGNGPPRTAQSWLTDADLNPYELVEGRPPAAADEVVINRGAAISGDLTVGDRTIVQLPGPVEVEIVGIATFGGADGLGATTMTAFTLDAAQELVARSPGTVGSVLVRAEPGVDVAELRTRIGDQLPVGVEAISGSALVQERLDGVGFVGTVRTTLVMFAVIALFVAGLGINNAFAITVAQRTRELALLRAVGASRRQVRRLVTLEAALIGAAAAAVGVIGGLGVAAALKAVFVALGLGLPASGLTVRPSAVAVSLAVGIAATVVAARLPARRAGRVAPVEALRTSAAELANTSRRRTAAGIVALGLGAALAGVGTAGVTMLLVGLGALALVAGTLLIAPMVMAPFARVLGSVLRRARGVNGALADQNARRQPRRSANTATALLIGVAVVTLFTVFAASMSGRIQDEVSAGFGDADLSIATPFFGGGTLSPNALDDLDALPEIDQAVGVARAEVVIDGARTAVTATDLATSADVLAVTIHAGTLDVGADQIVMSAERANDDGRRVGDTIELTYLDGTTATVEIGAVIDDHDILGDVVLPVDALFDRMTQPAYANVFMTLTDGTSLETGRQAIADVAQRYTGDVQDRAEFAEAASTGLDLLLSLVYAMLALAIVIALLGIANTLSMAVYERRHEIGLLRAVGQTRRQTRSVLRLEAVIVAAFGTILGLVLGTTLGTVLYSATTDGDRAITVPWASLAVIAIAASAAGVVAARRPARRAARLDILDAIATS